jgi:hypothetical protein
MVLTLSHRDFSGNIQIQSSSTEQPAASPSSLQRVNVYDLQFAHCAHCLLQSAPSVISGSRGAAAVAVACAALQLGMGQVQALQ